MVTGMYVPNSYRLSQFVRFICGVPVYAVRAEQEERLKPLGKPINDVQTCPICTERYGAS